MLLNNQNGAYCKCTSNKIIKLYYFFLLLYTFEIANEILFFYKFAKLYLIYHHKKIYILI